MVKTTVIGLAMLMALAAGAQAQAAGTGAAPRGTPPQVLGQTGTMSNGNNAQLKLPPEPNAYWVSLWSAPTSAANYGPASNVGPAAASSSTGGPPVGGQH